MASNLLVVYDVLNFRWCYYFHERFSCEIYDICWNKQMSYFNFFVLDESPFKVFGISIQFINVIKIMNQ